MNEFPRSRWLDAAFAAWIVFLLVAAVVTTSPLFIRNQRAAATPGTTTAPLARVDGKVLLTLDSVSVGNATPIMLGADPKPLVHAHSGQNLTINGWAVDASASAAAGGLLAQIDEGRRIPASYGVIRPDVAQAVGISDLATGFGLVVPAELLGPGRHEFSFLVLTQARNGFYLIRDRLEVEISR